jgi:hypothetical protein
MTQGKLAGPSGKLANQNSDFARQQPLNASIPRLLPEHLGDGG